MVRIAVIYKSKYGSTKKYAQWISSSLHCDLYDRKSIRPKQMHEYEIIVYGGGLYAGGVNGISLLSENADLISNQTIILFTCGLADPSDPQNVAHIRSVLSKKLPQQLLEKIKVFHLRGGIDYSQLGPIHKAMMAMLHKMVKNKDYDSLRSEDKEMLSTYGKVVDFTNKAAIYPIVDYIKGIKTIRM